MKDEDLEFCVYGESVVYLNGAYTLDDLRACIKMMEHHQEKLKQDCNDVVLDLEQGNE